MMERTEQERSEKRPIRQIRPGWQKAGAGPAPDTVDSGTAGVRTLAAQSQNDRIWQLRTTDCLSMRSIAAELHISTATVVDSLQRSIAERTGRVAGETDGWRQAQTERYAALRQSLQRCLLDPDAPHRDVALTVQTMLRLERDVADLWGLRIQTGRDALAEAVADVVKARVDHGRRERRSAPQQEQPGDGPHGKKDDTERDAQGKKTNRAGGLIGEPYPSPPQTLPQLLECRLLDEDEVAALEAQSLAKGDLVLPTLPVAKGERDLPRRHGMTVTKETRAVLEARIPVPAWAQRRVFTAKKMEDEDGGSD